MHAWWKTSPCHRLKKSSHTPLDSCFRKPWDVNLASIQLWSPLWKHNIPTQKDGKKQVVLVLGKCSLLPHPIKIHLWSFFPSKWSPPIEIFQWRITLWKPPHKLLLIVTQANETSQLYEYFGFGLVYYHLDLLLVHLYSLHIDHMPQVENLPQSKLAFFLVGK